MLDAGSSLCKPLGEIAVDEIWIKLHLTKEWLKERECLLKDMTTNEGKLETQMPDSSSESYASYLKMMAVYGKIDNMEESTEITDWLGKRKTVISSDSEEFRQQVERYIIQSEDTEEELQYWPLVERVRLKIPNCDVCRSGAKLVDLPGVSDYNAARENVTKEYLKTCKAVWVVSNIHRAIDAKLAKNLLDENFRRQLLMDGHYPNIAFICSKTDDIDHSECTKVNRIMDKQGEVNILGAQIIAKGNKKSQYNEELQWCKEEENRIKQECDRIKQLQSGESSEDPETINEQIGKQMQDLSDIGGRIDWCKGKINGIEQALVALCKKRSAICAEARNEYSSQQIKKDFKAGLREMKSEGRVHDEGKENEADKKLADSLHVFCCSATEYQRIQNPLPDDEPPKVFSNIEEMEVPKLRRYVHTVTQKSKIKAMNFLKSSLSRLLSDVLNLVTNSSMENDLTAIRNYYVEQSNDKFKAIIKTMSDEVQRLFTDIKIKLTEGSIIAEQQAKATCSSWGNTDEVVQDVEQVCESFVEDLKTELKNLTVTQSNYGALITRIKNCAKILRSPGAISSSQGSQQEIKSASIQHDTQEGKSSSQGSQQEIGSTSIQHDTQEGQSKAEDGKSQSYGQSEGGSGEPARETSSVSPLKRKMEFDEQFKDNKRQKKVYKPGDLDLVLKQSKVDYEEQFHIEQKLKENCSDYGLEHHGDTPRNGDCFFGAIASQMSRIYPQQSALSPLQLRQNVSEYIRQNPTYDGLEGSVSLEKFIDTTIEEYCEKMAKPGTWADHVVVITMARMLEHNIVIVTSSPSTSSEECLIWVIWYRTDKKPPLLLGHLWENHYQSLKPSPN